MAQGYISAERSIAAAGAAFACPEEDFSGVVRTQSNIFTKCLRVAKAAVLNIRFVRSLFTAR